MSVNPAWRKALTHSVITAEIPYNATLAERKSIERSISDQTKLFTNIAPGKLYLILIIFFTIIIVIISFFRLWSILERGRYYPT